MLSNKVTIYLPTHDPNKVRYYARRMTDIFGGCTAVTGACGYWVDPSGKLIPDEITLLQSFSDRDPQFCYQNAKMLCLQILVDFSQQCVSLEFNGTLYFIQ